MASGLIIWLFAVVYITVAGRQPADHELSLLPFSSYVDYFRNHRVERLRSNFMNTMLFYPPVLLLWELLPRKWNTRHRVTAVLLGAATVSLAIECLQYFGGLGLAETDDIIHNTLGAALAAVLCRIRFRGSKL